MLRSLFLFLFMVFLLPLPAFSAAGEWQKDEAAAVRLISATEAVGQDKTISLGLDVQLAPDWHTYWRSPGMAGLPPQIDWQNSLSDEANLQSAELLYPAPKRYTAFGLETIGYRDHVVFPIEAQLRAPGHALTINASVSLLVCSAICVPKTYELKLAIPEGAAKPTAEADLIQQYRDMLPGDAEKSGFAIQSIGNDGKNLIVDIQSRDELQEPDLFVEDDKDVSFSAPVTTIAADKHSVRFSVKPADNLPERMTLTGMKVMLTVVDGADALERHVTVPAISTEPTTSLPPPMPLGVALLFALVGGFILNLMPCVLPVLSLKILGVISHGGGAPRKVRHSFLMTSAGILFSYLALAGVTVGLKQLGLSFGWGIQFQQPVFVIGLILLLTFFSANLWGVFEIQLPRFLADNLDASYHPKLAGDFATGALATLLATPCSAPFLGTAIGFALSAGTLQILIVFTALGCGMMLPYLAIALFPRLATALPKPGAWMISLRRLLGLALAVTAIWLDWVLAAQISPRYAAVVGLLMTGVVILLALRKTLLPKKLISYAVLGFILGALMLTYVGSHIPKEVAEVDRLWLPFDERAIETEIDENKTVFIDVTADWCLTCKANKKLVLSREDVSQRLFHTDIIAMQADWTNPDPIIVSFLQKYGRYGIPFNIVFGPGAPQGIALPELLTPQDVFAALDKASKK